MIVLEPPPNRVEDLDCTYNAFSWKLLEAPRGFPQPARGPQWTLATGKEDLLTQRVGGEEGEGQLGWAGLSHRLICNASGGGGQHITLFSDISLNHSS